MKSFMESFISYVLSRDTRADEVTIKSKKLLICQLKPNEKMRVSPLQTTSNSDLLGFQLNEAAEVSRDEVGGVSVALSSGDVATGE